MKEFATLRFPNTPEGQKKKVNTLAAVSAQGWHVISETIEQGEFKGKNACCLFMICPALAFLAGREDSAIHVTLECEQVKKCPYCAEVIKAEEVKCRFCGSDLPQPETAQAPLSPAADIPSVNPPTSRCQWCGATVYTTAKICSQCFNPLK